MVVADFNVFQNCNGIVHQYRQRAVK
ncbi:hypothetical protein [Runella sp. SP2]|nr:hypothetical protein DTQ70_12395 [Runella sp. SP2]